jgi:hypothetical protein
MEIKERGHDSGSNSYSDLSIDTTFRPSATSPNMIVMRGLEELQHTGEHGKLNIGTIASG